MDENFSFGYWLRRQRLARDLRQVDLAHQLGIARITLRKIEADERRPSLQLLARLADYFALSDGERATLLAVARADLSPAALPLPRQPTELLTVPTSVAAPAPSSPTADGHYAEQLDARAVEVVAPIPRPLPRQLTPFIGRTRELGDLVARLRDPDARLVSVVAPGGMGKTRLALAAAALLQGDPAFRNGVAFAALAPVHEPTGLDPLLAGALGLPLTSAERSAPRAQLLDYLRKKEVLLVLDNCEHLREPILTLVQVILEAAPGVTVLTTSRERLGMRVEHVLLLDGMASDAGGATLFTTSARNVRLAFVLNEMTRPQVTAICACVGGMPLAIELAAGWADTLSLDEIAAELARGDALLVSQASDLPVRHHSVRMVWDTTWTRLSDEEQGTFARLAVFRGGGTREAVQAVTGASLAELHGLVGKALLRYDPERGRYAVHELLRQYAAERLAADVAAECGAQERHAAYYLGTLAAREAALKGERQLTALAEIGQDIENIQAAWRWAAETGAIGLLTPAVTCLCLAYERLGRSEEGWAAFAQATRVVMAVPVPAVTQALFQAAQSRFALLRGDGPGAQALLARAQAALDLLDRRDAATHAVQAMVLLQVGRSLAGQDLVAARDALTRSMALFASLDDQWGVATCQAALGLIIITLDSNYHDAWGYLEQSAVRYRALGDQFGLIETLTTQSMTARYLTRVPESLALAQEAYTFAQKTGNPRLIAQAGSNLGAALYWSDRNAEAYAILHSALTAINELGDQEALQLVSYRLGVALANLGRYSEARAICASRLAIAQQAGDARESCYLLTTLSSIALAEDVAQEALHLVEKALAYSARLGEGYNRNIALLNGALAARRLGDTTRALTFARAGLRFAVETRARTFSLLSVALLLADSGMTERSAAVMALAGRMQQFDNALYEDIALRELGIVLAALPPDTLARAQAHWAAYDYWEALHALLAEFEAKSWKAE